MRIEFLQSSKVRPSAKGPVQSSETPENRRQSEDRRARPERRRSALGLFELRAKRDKIVEDRRQTQRRAGSRFRFAFWRRTST